MSNVVQRQTTGCCPGGLNPLHVLRTSCRRDLNSHNERQGKSSCSSHARRSDGAVSTPHSMAAPACSKIPSLISATLKILLAFTFMLLPGCGSKSTSPHSDHGNSATPPAQPPGEKTATDATPVTWPVVRWVNVPELPQDIQILDSVFWEPADTVSLRQRIISEPRMSGARVLEIGTGSGLVSLCCLQAGAEHVIATDLNPAAVANALANARLLGFAQRLDVRQVPRRAPEAWTVIRPEETFDFIISNPPWEDRKPVSVQEFALYDPGFLLLKSLVTGARSRLRPGGRLWLAYGCVTAIRHIQETAGDVGLNCRILDERRLEDLPELFLPGMLLEITVP